MDKWMEDGWTDGSKLCSGAHGALQDLPDTNTYYPPRQVMMMPFPRTRSAWHNLATAVILKNSFNMSWFKCHPLCEASLVLGPSGL